jgi:hypothetical protein
MVKPLPNFTRMLNLIDDVFATRKDTNQLQVSQKVMKKLQQLHSATLSELANDEGPISWVLIIPTMKEIMTDFLQGKISENELLERTNPGDNFECLYLCSATTLPEFRSKGETKKLCIKAINEMCKDFAIKTLFVWPFTKEGEILAEKITEECELVLFKLNNKRQL